MKFHDRRSIPPKYIYLFLAIICFVLLFLSVIFENQFRALKKVTSTLIVPMQSGINSISSSVYNNVTDHKAKEELMEENNKLSAKLDEYSALLKGYEQKNYELERLQDLLELRDQYSEYKTTGARVIATDSTNWFYSFLIDKGSKDGIQVGCNVLADGGLAGIVTEVGEDYAKVRSIIDDNSNVSASIAGTDILCTVSGDLLSIKNGYINVEYINKASEIEEHAELVTSHVSDKFLPGLLIGYITELKLDANNLTKSAKCMPVVDFANLREVLVVLDLRANYKTNSDNKNIYDSVNTPVQNIDKTRPSAIDETEGDSSEENANTDNQANNEDEQNQQDEQNVQDQQEDQEEQNQQDNENGDAEEVPGDEEQNQGEE